MTNTTLGLMLLAERRARGLQQRDAAALLHVSQQTFSKWERDDAAPDLRAHGDAVAAFLGVSRARVELVIALGADVPADATANEVLAELRRDLAAVKAVVEELNGKVDGLTRQRAPRRSKAS